MGFQVEERNFTRIKGASGLAASIVNHMIANGFTKVFPTAAINFATDTHCVLEASATVNELHPTQPWRIKFDWSKNPDNSAFLANTGGALDVYVATPAQLKNDGSHTMVAITTTISEAVGLVGTANRTYVQTNPITQKFFLDRQYLSDIVANPEVDAYPMSYQLSITDRGFALCVWQQGSDNKGNRHSWVVVQRPVNHADGQTVITGKSPVFCMYGTMFNSVFTPWDDASSNFCIRRFTVSESDITVPAPIITPETGGTTAFTGVDAAQHTKDYSAVINPKQQVAITEDNKYIITFPNGFNTARFAYTHELDMIAFTSADVVSQGTEIPLTVYGELTPRKYKAMCANGPNNTGMRLCLLIEGGGI